MDATKNTAKLVTSLPTRLDFMPGPIITTTRAGLTYRAEMGERHVTIIGESADESTNHLRAARELRRDLGLEGGLHGRDEGEGRMSWSVGWVRR